jgi:hypothetical protein
VQPPTMRHRQHQHRKVREGGRRCSPGGVANSRMTKRNGSWRVSDLVCAHKDGHCLLELLVPVWHWCGSLTVQPSDKLTLVAHVRTANRSSSSNGDAITGEGRASSYSLRWDDGNHEVVSMGR